MFCLNVFKKLKNINHRIGKIFVRVIIERKNTLKYAEFYNQ